MEAANHPGAVRGDRRPGRGDGGGPAGGGRSDEPGSRSWLQDERLARRRPADRQHARTPGRRSRPTSRPASSRRGWAARTPTGGWISSTPSPRIWARPSCGPISRSVIDVNRDPSGASLYPGQAPPSCAPPPPSTASRCIAGQRRTRPRSTAGRCGSSPTIRRPAAEIARLRASTRRWSSTTPTRSARMIPACSMGPCRNFNHRLERRPDLRSDPDRRRLRRPARSAEFGTQVVNGRFKGGWSTRHYGQPVHRRPRHPDGAGCRGYIDEPEIAHRSQLADPYDADRAAALRAVLTQVLNACLRFAQS
jgi:N-formylglutamate deformylase